LTPVWGTNTIWIEQNQGKADYVPVEMAPGQLLVFDGVNLMHGNKLNDTGSTRVSFDFRCVPMSRYEPTEKRTVSSGIRLALGEYFDLMDPARPLTSGMERESR
jgi:ectoine hydroxylase-related dioxygenase (phytanoyl-CoA dioxygenase family)